jgi:ATP-dependent RNA helicase DeaD
VHINLSPARITVDTIRQSFITVDPEKKLELLLRLLEREKPRQCIIFCERKRWAEELYREVRKHHKWIAVMHGDLQQRYRTLIMEKFREGKIHYLVATDVVSRGIDVTGISHIVNYDLPEDPENYVHRIGRTGRMGKDGIAIAFVTPEQGKQLTNIENYINKMLDEDRMDGFVSYTPKPPKEDTPPKATLPVFGRRTRRYSRRV